MKKVVGDNSFQNFPVAEFQADPETLHFRPGVERSPLRFGGGGKIADEADTMNLVIGDGQHLAFHREQFDAFGLLEGEGIDITSQRLPLETPDENFFGGGGRQSYSSDR